MEGSTRTGLVTRVFGASSNRLLCFHFVCFLILAVASFGIPLWLLQSSLSSSKTSLFDTRSDGGGVLTLKGRQIRKWDPPKLVWLLSYPNSGTSYTMVNTRSVTQRQFASNYGKEFGRQPRMLLYNTTGPYIDSQSSLPLPRHYILTKTHCGGYCAYCAPHQFVVQSVDQMKQYCAAERVATGQSRPRNTYNPEQHVAKVIHLYRNPLDNAVSRMHHDSNNRPNRVAGRSDRARFLHWCRGLTNYLRNHLKSPKYIPKNISRWMREPSLVCGPEFFRYIQWHNRIYEMTTITVNGSDATREWRPILYVHYEDYVMDYDATVDKIVQFLQQTRSRGGGDGGKTVSFLGQN